VTARQPGTPVLTVYQPWASSMFLRPRRFAKPVENRGRRWKIRGPLWIHAAATWDTAGELSPLVAAAWARAHLGAPRPDNLEIPAGAIIGQVTITGCHPAEEPWEVLCDPWAARGQWHIELADPRPLAEPLKIGGQRGVWYLPADLEAACRAQLDLAASHQDPA
jgi:hypothetical protein